MTSTPNETAHELLSPIFHDEDNIQELSNVHSRDSSLNTSQTKVVRNSIERGTHHSPAPFDKAEPIYSSRTASSTSLNHSLTQTLFKPKARRPDGSEVPIFPANHSFTHVSSHETPFDYSCFPRSLKSREKCNLNSSSSKRQLPSVPIAHSDEEKSIEYAQFDTHQLYHLLDHLDNESQASSPSMDFTRMLDQLTLSTCTNPHPFRSPANQSLVEDLDASRDTTPPNLFDQSLPSAQETHFYTTITIPMDNPKNLSLYTMTLGTVQFSTSLLLPYSILMGRRPLLVGSTQTDFKPVRSKRQRYTCQVTAIESSLKTQPLKQNDILLKVIESSFSC